MGINTRLRKVVLNLLIALMSYGALAQPVQAQFRSKVPDNSAKLVQIEKRYNFLRKQVKEVAKGVFRDQIDSKKLEELMGKINEAIAQRKDMRISFLQILANAGLPKNILKQRMERYDKDIEVLESLLNLFNHIHHFELDEGQLNLLVITSNLGKIQEYLEDMINSYRTISSSPISTDETLDEMRKVLLKYLSYELRSDMLMLDKTISKRIGFPNLANARVSTGKDAMYANWMLHFVYLFEKGSLYPVSDEDLGEEGARIQNDLNKRYGEYLDWLRANRYR